LQRNELLDPRVGPADRVTPERIRGYVAGLLGQNAASTTASRVRHLYCALRAMAPEHDWGWMRDVESRIRRGAVSPRDKRALLVPSDQLFAYGVELMDQADGPAGGTTLRRAQYYRDGLLIALLAARLFRRRNLSSIEIGRHLLPQAQGYRLCFEAAETKTNTKIERTFPGVLVPYLERYLSHYRALLDPRTRGSRWVSTAPRPPTPALWISTHGTPMAATTVYARIVALTREKFGRSISPHLFRDCAGTSIATEDPEHVYVAMSALAHRTLKTAQRHYIHAQSLEAAKLYQGEVLHLKRGNRARRDSGASSGID
jgi:integrase/recombinase XerD